MPTKCYALIHLQHGGDCSESAEPEAWVIGSPSACTPHRCAGEPAPYLHLARAFEAMDATTKRLRISGAVRPQRVFMPFLMMQLEM